MDKGGVVYLGLIACAAGAVAVALGVGGDPRRISSGTPEAGPASFVNFESGHIHPVDLTPDGTRLLVCNTADNRLEVFDVTGGTPVLVSEIPVGMDPISVRARSNTEAWVVNHISDSVSVVNLATRNVVATLKTGDEPADVVFAGNPVRAFVTCSQENLVQVFDPGDLGAPPVEVPIKGKNPRALAVSPDGQTVYAAVFHSGNGTTILGGGSTMALPGVGFPPNVVSDQNGPYGGLNPPPNAGLGFYPPRNPAAGLPPRVGLIVRKDEDGRWMDDNGQDWTAKVSGPNAADSGRVVGWDLPDRDLAAIDASSLSVSYAHRLMNICMAVGVNPASGVIGVVGTDAINEVRFESNVKGRFVRVKIALVDPGLAASEVKDLNPHLEPYNVQQVPQSERDKSIGDPRAIVWNSAGTRGYVAGLGSNNVVVVDTDGNRAGLSETIEVGEGPTGLALDEARGRLYVLNRFTASISVVDTTTEQVITTVPFFDPTPSVIKAGRKHLYDTHKTSGMGQASCASCHVDGKMDHLAWDLGDPSGSLKQLTGQNLGAGIDGLTPTSATPPFAPWHPMKGPMVTQTLQDIIGKEPHHWRGDRDGIEEFNGAFVSLLGDDEELTPQEMQEFEDFLATITFPPNPFRNFDNSLPETLETGQFTPERFGPAGLPLPPGRPHVGLQRFLDVTSMGRLDTGAFACVTCHNLPTGTGPNGSFAGGFHTLPPGPNGEQHHQLVSIDGSDNVTFKTPHLRNAYVKLGFECSQPESLTGFGFAHDGAVDSIARFCSLPLFFVTSNQDIADLTAFIMCFSGSDLPAGSSSTPLNGPGTPSKDVPASVGAQTTLVNEAAAPASQLDLISQMIALAQANKVGLVVKGVVAGEQRGFVYRPATQSFQSDRASQVYTPAQLRALAQPGSELTYTVVPKGTETRIGIDRDENGVFDRDQLDLECYANCDGSHVPPVLNVNDFICFQQRYASGDPAANCDGSTAPPVLNVNDFVCFQAAFASGCP